VTRRAVTSVGRAGLVCLSAVPFLLVVPGIRDAYRFAHRAQPAVSAQPRDLRPSIQLQPTQR
jgi:hypothetical protein